jgi:hypothetical protein
LPYFIQNEQIHPSTDRLAKLYMEGGYLASIVDETEDATG